jgi:hypothetical protein
MIFRAHLPLDVAVCFHSARIDLPRLARMEKSRPRVTVNDEAWLRDHFRDEIYSHHRP